MVSLNTVDIQNVLSLGSWALNGHVGMARWASLMERGNNIFVEDAPD